MTALAKPIIADRAVHIVVAVQQRHGDTAVVQFQLLFRQHPALAPAAFEFCAQLVLAGDGERGEGAQWVRQQPFVQAGFAVHRQNGQAGCGDLGGGAGGRGGAGWIDLFRG